MYDRVKETHGFQPQVGRRVRHDETQKEGYITFEPSANCTRVYVHFDGAREAVPCHPGSLEYVKVSA